MKIKPKIFLTLLAMSLLVALVGVIALKHQRSSITTAAIKESENVASVLGSILVTDSDEFHTSPQAIINRLHAVQQRDMVLVNTNQFILADAVSTDNGKIYTEDLGDEVGLTIGDGRPRTFVENSVDSPLPIKQIVVAVKSQSGQTLGAVILEYTPLYDELMESTRATTRELIWVTLGSGLIALLIAIYMGRSIALPLQQLTRVAKGFAGGNMALPMPPPRKDEIGELADAFSDMMQKRQEAGEALRQARDNLEARVVERTVELETTHKKLLETSRKAGMAEVATGILHNVGNVLNSINITSACVTENLRQSKSSNLIKVVELLRQHESDLGAFMTADPKGKQIPQYLGTLADCLTAEQTGAIKELRDLQNNVDHIRDIVAMQQGIAKVSAVTEIVRLADVVDDALRMNASAFVRHDIVLLKEFNKVPSINVEKHKVLQILVNLVTNAKQGCDELNVAEKRITIRLSDHGESVWVEVIDNGIGIQPENLTRIFAHGFTTKKDGHGFGLHSGALAATEMGGSLSVHSDGPGKGATFTLKLPLLPPTRITAEAAAA